MIRAPRSLAEAVNYLMEPTRRRPAAPLVAAPLALARPPETAAPLLLAAAPVPVAVSAPLRAGGGDAGAPAPRAVVPAAPPPAVPAAGRGLPDLLSAAGTLNRLAGNPFGLPDPLGQAWRWAGQQLGGLLGGGGALAPGGVGASAAGSPGVGAGAAGTAGLALGGQAGAMLPAAHGAMLAGEAGLLPGMGGATAAASGPAAWGAGILAAAPVALPALALLGGALAHKALKKPSVGPNVAVRFGPDGQGALQVRLAGADNTDAIDRDAFAGWSRQVLGQALAEADLADDLDGALIWFPNTRATGGKGPYGARVDGETRYFAAPAAAVRAYVAGQHRQGRLRGDLPALLRAVDAAVAAAGAPDAAMAEARAAAEARNPLWSWPDGGP